MMVTFVSECEKKALPKTRRILDSFANRIGSRTWQSIVTEEGLAAIKKLLRQSATKSTAVSCHWIRSRSRSELLWVVGNRSKFNEEGIVPVNFTENDIQQYMDNHNWKTINVIRYAVAIAALFHDFGKATQLFQDKINPNKKTEIFEPFRHEWVSLRVFQAFVNNRNDEAWLESLAQMEFSDDLNWFKDGIDGNVRKNNPLNKLPPFAKLVAWLILSHHRLPLYPDWQYESLEPPKFEDVSNWVINNFDGDWNSYKSKQKDQADRINTNWQMTDAGLPFNSSRWKALASNIASDAQNDLQPFFGVEDWVNSELFTTHIARLSLMLSDHYFSSQDTIKAQWRDKSYPVWANSDRQTKQLKQQLDEHLIGVTDTAMRISKALPKLNASLNSLPSNDFLQKKVSKDLKKEFGWQDDAQKTAFSIANSTKEQGFFGINMASTGKGKTLANAKIMSAIGSKTGRTRFSVALGLRTLTLQTGNEYREKLKLTDEDLAIMVGGTAVRTLFENQQTTRNTKNDESISLESLGSESLDETITQDIFVSYQGAVAKHSLLSWTSQEKMLDHLINAPVLVCTIDHLMPASEGVTGGKQIVPMLRLLTSDLVLDEPDDFGLEDLPALCRLVNMAGMLGSRVLFSTATMPPSLAYALFLAYQDGWKEYGKANLSITTNKITCAWFDEFHSESSSVLDIKSFRQSHEKFVNKRLKKLSQETVKKRLSTIINIDDANSKSNYQKMAKTIHQGIFKLHHQHNQSKNKQTISFGLVRIANINPLVSTAIELLKLEAPEDTVLHYCIYHSRFPLAIRSEIENKLDTFLKRKDPNKIWEQIGHKINGSDKKHHIFIVVASPVSEVGRDHDYDWAIVEPSSMRSIIQLAGRVLRHRDKAVNEPNILLLNKNFKALSALNEPCFMHPGFELSELSSEKGHELQNILEPKQYSVIDATPRIVSPPEDILKGTHWSNLVDLEHIALMRQLFRGIKPANVWWKAHPHWCGEVQRQLPFRKSGHDEPFYLWVDNHNKQNWKWKNEHVSPSKFGEVSAISIKEYKLTDLGSGNDFWFELEACMIYSRLSEELHIADLEEVSRRFGEVRLKTYHQNNVEYSYHPNLGIFKEKDHS